MPRWLFPLLVLLLVALAALLAWLWWSDYLLIDQCLDAGGTWDDARRTCMLRVTTVRP
ncbi:hypothetical protein RZN05_15120 [Sphingomonas sp. HF-S4]|uniref:Uncharacterized protein n=1 Tax=Sphingomonas agrestis TaxID=3080540 RepID=A0ABU3YAN3_9SPHN|nr:hypothetical protein [Sphingomonas sp. HF-S4]MDV3458327.1 hypothetical protein [Sphingomonas sp. HF-S4]